MADSPTATKRSQARVKKKTQKAKIKPEKVAKKKLVQEELFEKCRRRKNYKFNNDLVKQVAKKNGFGNAYDATKVDSRSTLAPSILSKGFCIAHLGEGNHKFIKAADKWFHEFEEIKTEAINWPYRRSALN